MSKNESLSSLSINTIRALTLDCTRKADSGHPGAAMALAPVAYLLYNEIMDHNPDNPEWWNRDRFVLSAGHASAMLYASLYISGYDISLEDIKNFRQLDSKTPGHPEYDPDLGVETTTGPLGQGLMNSVGMAVAEAHLREKYNRNGYNIIDHFTYAICSDGDLMEGASHEAASIAGHLGLGKLIGIYDDNHISIEGSTELAYTEDVKKRFESYGWQVIDIGENANNLEKIREAISKAKSNTEQPTLIKIRTHIGYGAPESQDTPGVHGAPLDEDEIKRTKEFYGWPPNKKFYVPDEVKDNIDNIVEKGKKKEEEWKEIWDEYKEEYPELSQQLVSAFKDDLPEKIELEDFDESEGPIATRKASSKTITQVTEQIPWLIGGSADLSPSTKTVFGNSKYIQKDDYTNQNIAWGVRELLMTAATSGMYLHGGIRPFAATFFVFSDYARPALRLAAMMELPIVYVFTHDSIGLGEDGPTHQPVEHLASFRAMPNMTVIRPCDANEVNYAWKAALRKKDGPTMLALTRQSLPIMDRDKENINPAENTMKGAYILSPEEGEEPDVIFISSGSEVQIATGAKEELAKKDIDARVVSMPSWELFEEQDEEYKKKVLPPEVESRIAIEASMSFGWEKFVGSEDNVMAVDGFGSSGPYKEVFEKYNITIDKAVEKAEEIV